MSMGALLQGADSTRAMGACMLLIPWVLAVLVPTVAER